jgi:gluconokinase
LVPTFEHAVIVMGVASCGKTSIGQLLAQKLGVPFIEGDSLHPRSNVEKMSAGIPLDDSDRWPWLSLVGASLNGKHGAVTSCSALKREYRRHIIEAAQRPVAFVFLDGTRDLLARRIVARRGHFMPPSLLESQFAALEPPGQNELAMRFDAALPTADIVAMAENWLLNL